MLSKTLDFRNVNQNICQNSDYHHRNSMDPILKVDHVMMVITPVYT